MKMALLSEIEKQFRKIIVLAKVEKYVIIGNKWLIKVSEKTWEQAHKTVKSLKEIEEKYLNSKFALQKYFDVGQNWILDTPERALESAYKAALILKKIENEHLSGEITSIFNYSDSRGTYFHLKSNKYLITIKLRMIEFKVSNSIIDISQFSKSNLNTIIDRLELIDEVLTRYYQPKQTNPSMPVENSGFVANQVAGIFERTNCYHDQPTLPLPPEDYRLGTSEAEEQGSRGDETISPILYWEGSSLSMPEQSTDEQKICNQPDSEWKLLEPLSLPFNQEKNHQVSQVPTPVKFQPQRQSLRPSSSIQNWVRNIGLAATVFAGGFAGGVCSSVLLSSQDGVANNSTRYNLSTEVCSEVAQKKTKSTDTALNVSTPEIILSKGMHCLEMNAFE
jgi:hypothetical protein